MTGAQKVASWPRIEATMHPGPHRYEATLRINGTPTACAAPTAEALRAGIIARCATLASRLSRPVALDVNDQGQPYRLAVHLTGVVQAIGAGDLIANAHELQPIAGPCRRCAQSVIVTEPQCAACGEIDPLRMELEGFPAVRPSTPAADTSAIMPADARSAPAAPAERSELPEQTIFVRRRPILAISVEGGRSVTVPAPAVIGRDPAPVDGHSPVVLPSAGRELSRTHVLVDVDDEGRLVLTDQNSANGTFVDGHELAPHTPTIVPTGSRLQLGDVDIRVHSSVAAESKPSTHS